MKSWDIVFPARNDIRFTEGELSPPGEGQVLCRAEMSLISIGTELRCLRGESDPDTNWSGWLQYPFHPGYSMAATVAEVGAGVKGFAPGDRVVTQAPHSQYFIQDEGNVNLMHIPEGVSFAEAAWQPLGCITQLGARRAEVQLGDDIGIVGLGMLGQLVTQYLKNMGARRIVAIDMNEKRLAFAGAHGATHTFRGPAGEAGAFIGELTGGRGLDTIYDITGLPGTLAAVTPLLRRGGSVVLLGDNTKPSQQALGPNVVSDALNIKGIHGSMCPDESTVFSRWSWREMAFLFFDLLLDGRMNVRDMNTDVVSPAEAEKTFRWLADEKPDTFGVLFDWNRL